MSKMRELFIELSLCFQDCRGEGMSLIKSVKGGVLLCLGQDERLAV